MFLPEFEVFAPTFFWSEKVCHSEKTGGYATKSRNGNIKVRKFTALLSHKHVWKIVLWHSCHFHNIFERHLYSKDDSFVFHNTTTVPKKEKTQLLSSSAGLSSLVFRKMGIITDDDVVMKNVQEEYHCSLSQCPPRVHISWYNWTLFEKCIFMQKKVWTVGTLVKAYSFQKIEVDQKFDSSLSFYWEEIGSYFFSKKWSKLPPWNLTFSNFLCKSYLKLVISILVLAGKWKFKYLVDEH